MQQELLLAGMLLLAVAALFLAFRLWKKDQRRRADPWAGSELEGLFKTKTAQAQKVDPGIENEFSRIFMTTHKEGREALIKQWTDKGASRGKAMQSAIDEWRRDNR